MHHPVTDHPATRHHRLAVLRVAGLRSAGSAGRRRPRPAGQQPRRATGLIVSRRGRRGRDRRRDRRRHGRRLGPQQRTVASGITFSTATAQNTAKIDGTVTAAAAKIQPSVVTINVAGSSESGTGSGVILQHRRLHPDQQPRGLGRRHRRPDPGDHQRRPERDGHDRRHRRIRRPGRDQGQRPDQPDQRPTSPRRAPAGRPDGGRGRRAAGPVQHGHLGHRQQHRPSGRDRRQHQHATRCSTRSRPTPRSTRATPVARW